MKDIRSKMEQAKNEVAEAETQPAFIKQEPEVKLSTPQKKADTLGKTLCRCMVKTNGRYIV